MAISKQDNSKMTTKPKNSVITSRANEALPLETVDPKIEHTIPHPQVAVELILEVDKN